MKNSPVKSGFVALIGKPNVGKSTLLNKLIGQPISITADKPQTTRNRIRGIITESDYQAVILDTPGIHLPRNELHRRIIQYAVQTLHDTDLLFFITEPFSKNQDSLSEMDQLVLDKLRELSTKIILVLNKIDLHSPEQILHSIDRFNRSFNFLETVPISALKNKGIDILKSFFPKYLPEGIQYFPEDQMTDLPERVIVGEFVREQIMRHCFHEIPYGAAVIVESFEESDSLIKIYATIHVEKKSHKKIVIGRNGSMLKKVGQRARVKIEGLLGKKIYLSLHVKISVNWINNPRKLSEFGYPKS